MPILQAPCRGCNERYLGCHSQCSYYKAYKEQQAVRYEKRKNRIEITKDYNINGRSYRV